MTIIYILDLQFLIENVVQIDSRVGLLQYPIAHHARSESTRSDAEISQLAIRLRAKRIGYFDANFRNAVFQLHDLGRHNVGVVAASEREKYIRIVDSGFFENIVSEPAAYHDFAVMVGSEPAKRAWVLLDNRNAMPARSKWKAQVGASSAAAENNDLNRARRTIPREKPCLFPLSKLDHRSLQSNRTQRRRGRPIAQPAQR